MNDAKNHENGKIEKLYRRHKIKISISDIEKLFIGIKKT